MNLLTRLISRTLLFEIKFPYPSKVLIELGIRNTMRCFDCLCHTIWHISCFHEKLGSFLSYLYTHIFLHVYISLCIFSFRISVLWEIRPIYIHWLISGEVKERTRRKGTQEERKGRGTPIYYYKGLAVAFKLNLCKFIVQHPLLVTYIIPLGCPGREPCRADWEGYLFWSCWSWQS